jgi:GTP-binding protein Era
MIREMCFSVDGLTEEEDGPSPEEIARRIREETDDIIFEEDPPNHKMGFIAIIGRPNAGKSTLMNNIIGENLSIVTEKAQTTRHKVLGIWSEKGHQAVFLDTPGIIVNQKDELEERMMAAVTQAIKDADVLIAIIDVGDRPEQALEMIQPGDSWNGPPMAVLLNKIDTIDQEKYESIVQWYTENCKADVVIPISAETGENISILKDWVLEKIPEGPSMYPKDVLSEANERFFVSEIIRKNVFLQYRQELPYQVAVQVTEFKERTPPKKTFIQANVVVEKERHVKLLVGSKGSAIKALSLSSRAEIEDFLGVPVYLDLSVKVVPKWRSSDTSLSSLGYI